MTGCPNSDARVSKLGQHLDEITCSLPGELSALSVPSRQRKRAPSEAPVLRRPIGLAALIGCRGAAAA
jgi:hypothetical protein